MIDSPKPSRWTSHYRLSFCSLFVSLSLLFLLPSFLSTSWGGYCLQRVIRAVTSLDVRWEHCSIGWFSDAKIEGLTLRNPQNQVLLHVKEIHSTWRPSFLLFTPRYIGTTSIYQAQLDLSLISPQTDRWLYPLNPAHRPSRLRLPFYGDLQIEQSTLDCQLATDKELQLRNLTVALSVPKRYGPMICALTATSLQQEETGRISLLIDYVPASARTVLRTHADTARALTEQRLHVDMQMQHFPSLALDALLHLRHPSSHALISTAVGPFFDCRLHTQTALPNPKLSILYKSFSLEATCNLALDQKELLFSTEEPIRWHLTPEILHLFHLDAGLKEQITLQTAPVLELATSGLTIRPENDHVAIIGSVIGNLDPLLLHITSQAIPIQVPSCSATLAFAPHTMQWNGQLALEWNHKNSSLSSSGRYALGTMNALEEPGMQEMELSLEALPAQLLDLVVQKKELLQPLLGDVLAIHLSAQKSVDSKRSGHSLRCLFLSSKVHCDPIELFLDQTLTLRQPVEVRFTAPVPGSSSFLPSSLPVHFICEAFSSSASKPCEARVAFPYGILSLSLSDFKLPLPAPTSLKIAGRAVWSPRSHLMTENLLPFSTAIASQFSVNGADQTASIFFEPHNTLPSNSTTPAWHTTFTADHWIEEEKWSFDQARLHMDGMFPGLNVQLLEKFFTFPLPPSLLLGNSAACTFSATYDLAEQTDAIGALSLKGDGIETDLTCGWNHRSKRLDLMLGKFQWKLGPQRFAHLQELWPFLRDWTLYDDATLLFTAQTGQFSLSLQELQSGLIPFPIHVTSNALTLMHTPSKQLLPLTLSGLLDQDLHYQLHTYLGKQSDRLRPELLLGGSLKEIAAKNSQDVAKPSTITCQFKGHNLPTSLLNIALHTKPDLYTLSTAILGSSCELEGACSFNAQKNQLDLHVVSVSGMQLDLSTTGEDKRYRLDRPCTLLLPLFVLKKSMEPLLASPNKQPSLLAGVLRLGKLLEDTGSNLSITISPENSSLKLPYQSINDLEVGLMTIKMDRIGFQLPKKDSTLYSILPKEIKEGKFPLSLAMTPLFLSLKQGTLEIKRMDALIAERYPIAFWGKADLEENKVKATLAISAVALRNGYQLHDIPAHYFLLLPMSGTFQKIALHKTKALARLAALNLRSGGGIPGAVLGSFAHWLAGGSDSKKIPPPTAPIPWDSLEKEEQPVDNKQKSLPGQLIAPFKAVHRAVQKSVQSGADLLFNLF